MEEWVDPFPESAGATVTGATIIINVDRANNRHSILFPVTPGYNPVTPEQRAKAAFLRHLSEEQRRMWLNKQHCIVPVGPGHDFVLMKGESNNVWERRLIDGEMRHIATWCLSTRMSVPTADLWLAQLLYLRHHPKEFRRRASGALTFVGHQYYRCWARLPPRDARGRFTSNP